MQGGAHFGHLARLRTLELDSQVGGAGAATFDAHLAGLPSSLQRLSLQACREISLFHLLNCTCTHAPSPLLAVHYALPFSCSILAT